MHFTPHALDHFSTMNLSAIHVHVPTKVKLYVNVVFTLEEWIAHADMHVTLL